MKERIKTVQLRSTIFLQQNIGYTPENAEKFRSLLMPNCKIYGISQPGVPMFGVNPNMPQYGMSWRLFSRTSDGEYNIAFLPGKIDIVFVKEGAYNNDIEKEFCNQSIKWFSSILETQDNAVAIRIAYAPLYAIVKDEDFYNAPIWNNLLKKTIFNGIQAQDINLNFLLKSIINIGEKEIPINLLHNIFDGNKVNNDGSSAYEVLLIQLDLNTIPEFCLNIEKEGITEFFNNILPIKCKLIDNVTE